MCNGLTNCRRVTCEKCGPSLRSLRIPRQKVTPPVHIPGIHPPIVQDPHKELKDSIQKATIELKQNIVDFIEHQVEVNKRQVTVSPNSIKEPRLPIFYEKGYNVLKRLCKTINYQDPILQLLPQAVWMAMISEEVKFDLPEIHKSSGYLTSSNVQQPLEDVLKTFMEDIEDYYFNYISMHQSTPKVPRAYDLMKTYFRKRAEMEKVDGKTKEFYENSLDDYVNAYLTAVLGEEHVHKDHFKKNNYFNN